ncbi:TPA: flavin reductase [Candidatus Latescibacteria bacterium]|nr:flavin reductase [Candidatus Latescibacterota bacterium]|tara:strand:- start:36 stop:653 length:618 start_codon:yes stop_codon:yes gene_type:complete
MFYEPSSGHDLPNNPLNALIVPRPIGWISTLGPDGTPNLAPYSFFNAVAYDPPQVMFAATSGHRSGGPKDSVMNARKSGEFVVNMATFALRERMNASATPAPREVDEFEHVGLTTAPSAIVSTPRVAESPAHLECRTNQVINLPSDDPDDGNTLVLGEVVGVHIDDRFIVDGKVDLMTIGPIGRLGYLDYVEVNNRTAIERPTWP